MWETDFSKFLRDKRKQQYMTLSDMADKAGISLGYYSDIEYGRRNPPDREILDRMAAALHLSDADRTLLYDLAGKARSEAPSDLSEYINEHDEVRVALRMAKETGDARVWNKFINYLEFEKGGGKDG